MSLNSLQRLGSSQNRVFAIEFADAPLRRYKRLSCAVMEFAPDFTSFVVLRLDDACRQRINSDPLKCTMKSSIRWLTAAGPASSISRGSLSVSQPFLRVAAPCSPVVAGLGLRHRRYEKLPRELRARPDSRESTKSIQLVRQ